MNNVVHFPKLSNVFDTWKVPYIISMLQKLLVLNFQSPLDLLVLKHYFDMFKLVIFFHLRNKLRKNSKIEKTK